MTIHDKQFAKYVVPSLISFVLSGLYCFVDAYFVGNNVGDSGIAAINIAFSFLSLAMAVGFGMGIGASVLFSIKKDNSYIKVSYILMVVLSFVITVPAVLFPVEFLETLGATKKIAMVGKPYMQILAAGSIIQVLSCGIGPILRNYGAPDAAMASMVSGLVSNIFLDWLFVAKLQLGMIGAASASVIAQAISLVIGLAFIPKHDKYKKIGHRFMPVTKEIFKVGISPLGLTVIPNVTIIIVNRCCLKYGGDSALGAYGCISYLTYIVLLVIQGLDDGAQPLISKSFGENNQALTEKYNSLTLFWALVVSIICAFAMAFTGYAYGMFMGASGEVSNIIKQAMYFFAFGVPLTAVNRTLASVFYACTKNLKSYLLSYTEPVFILIFCLFLPGRMGLNGIWFACVCGQFCVLVLGLFLKLSDSTM